MARSKDTWCVLSVIKFNEFFAPCVVLSIHRTKEDAQALANELSQDWHWPTTTRLMKCTRYIRGLKEGDVLCCHKIDMILNYFEKELDSDAIREEA